MNYSFNHSFVHIDPAVIEDFRTLMPGQPEFANGIITSFLRASPMMLDALRTAIFAGEIEAVKIAAHKMKSSNAQIGARRLAALCHQIERYESMDEIPDATALFQELETEYRGVESELGIMLVRFMGN